MKTLILAGLIASAFAVSALPVYAQTSTDTVVQKQSMDSILNILNNADSDTSPEELKKDLVDAINLLCQSDEDTPKNIELDLKSGRCSAADIDKMITEVVAALGVDNALISDFLTSLVASGINSDAVTLAAIIAGVDATIASEATAAGPTITPAVPVIVNLPIPIIPPGAGGTGGDTGISEVGN
ncbi:hypothetical protein [Pseudoalteromonas sp. TB64]|uniref:hypothetical protein n=1 Tax=Pseudoalteromonas sp. TB64 TaxID=1938600 RepID=UPI0004239226|nr:hypothetical protein [Pseudoalteromonas sp. TB64]